MEAFKKNLELENSLIKLTKQSINDIDSIGRIEIQNEEIQILRTQYLLFLKFSLSFFVRRAIFITKAISLDEGFDKDEKGILRNILRGLIEIVAKIYYAKNERKKFAQNYLWEQLKACLLSLFLSIKNGGQIFSIKN
jgi:hypothetical protein